MKKITLDVRPEVHYRLRLLSVVLDRSLSSLVNEALEKLLQDFPSVTADALQDLEPVSRNAKKDPSA